AGFSGQGVVTQVISLLGSNPTYAAMLAKKRCGGDPSPGTLTLFPLRSLIVRTRSFPNSSRQPTWSPESRTIGLPVLIRRIAAGPNAMLMSAAPEVRTSEILVPTCTCTYCTSVNPSRCRSSSAIYCGASQRLPISRTSLTVAISGGGSAATGWARTPRRPAVPASVSSFRNSRRVFIVPPCPLALALQLFLQLVEEPPVGPLRDDLLSSKLLGLGRESHEGIDPASREALGGLDRRLRDDMDVLARIEADVHEHGGENKVMTGLERHDANGPPLQVADRADPVGSEQFVAADMNSRQNNDRIPSIDPEDELSGG